MRLEVMARCSVSRARASLMHLPQSSVSLPVFMPVGTQGAMKGVTCDQLRGMGCEILLGNTYHLGHRPGPDLLLDQGGLHSFMDWQGAILTDSGGFQMVSLLQLAEISEEGVLFASPHDSTLMMLRPEESMRLQMAIGSDIVMQLDDVTNPLSSQERLDEAMRRSIRWLDRCKAALHPDTDKGEHPRKGGEESSCRSDMARSRQAAGGRNTGQSLFAIVQGGLDLERRSTCLTEMVARNTPGYAIGGLGGGEQKDDFWRMVSFCAERLRGTEGATCKDKNKDGENKRHGGRTGVDAADGDCGDAAKDGEKPIYCMGIGYDLDLVVCVSLGVDMFDCVFPTRTARFGHALHRREGDLSLKNACYAYDFGPIEEGCPCITCRNYTRSYLHSLVTRETVGCHLITLHNLTYMLRFMKEMRTCIINDCFPQFVATFVRERFSATEDVPSWIMDALSSVNIHLSEHTA